MYEEVVSLDELTGVVESALEEYNQTHKNRMNLVIFRFCFQSLKAQMDNDTPAPFYDIILPHIYAGMLWNTYPESVGFSSSPVAMPSSLEWEEVADSP